MNLDHKDIADLLTYLYENLGTHFEQETGISLYTTTSTFATSWREIGRTVGQIGGNDLKNVWRLRFATSNALYNDYAAARVVYIPNSRSIYYRRPPIASTLFDIQILNDEKQFEKDWAIIKMYEHIWRPNRK